MSILVKLLGDAFRPTPVEAPGEEHSLRIFIGFDHRQPVGYTVLQQSILARSTEPVSITPLVLPTLPIQRQGLTPFTYSRFLVPWLCNFRGWALFLDLDMIVRADIADLFAMGDPQYAAMVVKNQQRFEWASAILYNCAHPANAVLTPDYVDDPARCQTPHHLDWLPDDLVGALPAEWNHCVGYDTPNPQAKLVHYTQGVPFHPEVAGCEYHDEWYAERDNMCASIDWTSLMGNSVHAATLHDGTRVPKLVVAPPEAPSPPDRIRSEPTEAAKDRAGATDRYRQLVELYKDMHTRGDTINGIPADKTFDGRSLVAHLPRIGEVAREFGARTILDYGCGKGLSYNGTVTLADGTVVESVQALWGVDAITLYDPGYAPYSAMPEGTFDGVVSTDVLEHCPEEDIDWIVGEMFGFARSFVYLTISCRLAVKHLPNGENAHITVKSPEWWSDLLTRVAANHPGVRYYATCYGEAHEATLLRG